MPPLTLNTTTHEHTQAAFPSWLTEEASPHYVMGPFVLSLLFYPTSAVFVEHNKV